MNLEQVAALPVDGASRAALRDCEAVWIREEGLRTEILEERIQRLFAAIGLRESRAEGITACVEAPDIHPAIYSLLESRFGRVETGVPAREFLAEGPQARGWVLAGPVRVRTVAVLDGSDFWALGQAMEKSHRHALGGGWSCEAAPGRLTYVMNLEDPSRTLSGYFAVPDPSEVEALWIHRAADEPLALAEHLDRMDRIPGLGSSRIDTIPVWISSEEVTEASRNVLEARFERLVFGVPAFRLLSGEPIR